MSKRIKECRKVAKVNDEPTKTKRGFTETCDLPSMVESFTISGVPPHLVREGRYGDATGPQTLQEALDLIDLRGREFDELPARVRAACRNDLVLFEAALADPEKLQELVDLGLEVDGMAPRPAEAAAPPPPSPEPEEPPLPLSPQP